MLLRSKSDAVRMEEKWRNKKKSIIAAFKIYSNNTLIKTLI